MGTATGGIDFVEALRADRVVSVVRAERVPDPVGLVRALVAGGIRCVELTFTIPGVVDLLRTVAGEAGACVGVGTVLRAEQARAAVSAGARFLVTPGLRPEVAEVARAFSVPLLFGAMTPTEVLTALDLGASAVKVFPAHRLGPGYLRDLHGPLPDVALVPSGGITAENAAEYLRAGALAVSCGTGVVPPVVVGAGGMDEIERRARQFVAALEAG